MRAHSFLLAAAVGLSACQATADPRSVAGTARVVDGDSLDIDATELRLFGVDAPEGRQSCGRGAAEWQCGKAAASKLREIVGTSRIVCVRKDTDTYGRTVAVCRNGERDLAREMVESGLALAYRRYSDDYVAAENEAKAARRGVWSGEFTAPWDWRRDGRTTTEPAASSAQRREPSDGCLIKGNINRDNERIYHLPGSRDYEATKIDPDKGESWFCSEKEARDAGWRRPGG